MIVEIGLECLYLPTELLRMPAGLIPGLLSIITLTLTRRPCTPLVLCWDGVGDAQFISRELRNLSLQVMHKVTNCVTAWDLSDLLVKFPEFVQKLRQLFAESLAFPLSVLLFSL